MGRVRLVVSLSVVAAIGLLGSKVVVAPVREAPTELDVPLARCEIDESACPMLPNQTARVDPARPEEHSAPGGSRRRVSEGGYDYGECYGSTLAVELFPEPCDRTLKAENALLDESDKGAARIRQLPAAVEPEAIAHKAFRSSGETSD